MYNQEKIMKDIASEVPFAVLNAIIDGTKSKIKEKWFIEAVVSNKGNDETIMHIPISSFAYASLDVLGIEQYTGNDENVLKLIKTGFNFG